MFADDPMAKVTTEDLCQSKSFSVRIARIHELSVSKTTTSLITNIYIKATV